MAKKTARANRPAQQRSKEEQWRKRMAAQARTGGPATPVGPGGTAGAVRERERAAGAGAGETYEDGAETPAGTARANTSAPARSRPATSATTSARAQSATAALQRRATAARASSRARIGASALSIEDEMRYIKG